LMGKYKPELGKRIRAIGTEIERQGGDVSIP
jgi:hypothetical protein